MEMPRPNATGSHGIRLPDATSAFTHLTTCSLAAREKSKRSSGHVAARLRAALPHSGHVTARPRTLPQSTTDAPHASCQRYNHATHAYHLGHHRLQVCFEL